MSGERVSQAAELRQRGLSLRSIAAILGCSEGTVRNDLKRWEAQQVEALLTQLRKPPGSQLRNPQVSDETTAQSGDAS